MKTNGPSTCYHLGPALAAPSVRLVCHRFSLRRRTLYTNAPVGAPLLYPYRSRYSMFDFVIVAVVGERARPRFFPSPRVSLIFPHHPAIAPLP